MNKALLSAYVLNSVTDGQLLYAYIETEVLGSLADKHPKEVSPTRLDLQSLIRDLVREGFLEIRSWDCKVWNAMPASADLDDRLCYIFLTKKGRDRLAQLWTKDLDEAWNS
jgi:hypothetical protein